jgi:hypothetical protein
VSTVYDRERVLQSRLNAFIQEQLRLPASDYYSPLNARSLGELKSVRDINNIFTLKAWDVQRHGLRGSEGFEF